MAQSLSKVYLHIVFSTKYRRKFIDKNIRPRLFDYVGGVCNGLECQVLQVGGYDDHVHILCQMSRKITQMKLLEEIKKRSSAWIKTIDKKYLDFYWQRGYGIFSVDKEGIDSVIEYIANQEQHHASMPSPVFAEIGNILIP
ncbi:MAG: IS200/IS605 family transposase, partial [Bacteroidota bacterium]